MHDNMNNEHDNMKSYYYNLNVVKAGFVLVLCNFYKVK